MNRSEARNDSNLRSEKAEALHKTLDALISGEEPEDDEESLRKQIWSFVNLCWFRVFDRHKIT